MTAPETCHTCRGTGQVPLAAERADEARLIIELRQRIADLRRTLRWIADQPGFGTYEPAALLRQMATCARIALDEDLP